MIVPIHAAFGLIALASGAWNLVTPKGTRRHRLMGRIYAGAMVALILSSFAIFEVIGSFGPFHVLSLVSGGTLAMAVVAPLRRQKNPDCMEAHYMWITYSYIGLIMATGSHFFDALPAWPYWTRAILFWGLPLVIGSVLVYAQKQRILGHLQPGTHSSEGG